MCIVFSARVYTTIYGKEQAGWHACNYVQLQTDFLACLQYRSAPEGVWLWETNPFLRPLNMAYKGGAPEWEKLWDGDAFRGNFWISETGVLSRGLKVLLGHHGKWKKPCPCCDLMDPC
jgi:hypothetical protein